MKSEFLQKPHSSGEGCGFRSSPKGSGEMEWSCWVETRPCQVCPLNLSTHLALPTSSAGHSHSQEGETELSKYTTAVLFESCSFVRGITF